MDEAQLDFTANDLDPEALANAAKAALRPPPPLPVGWLLKESRSQPNYFYYYNIETGISSWESPNLSVEAVEQETEETTGTPNEYKFVEEIVKAANSAVDNEVKKSNSPSQDADENHKKRPVSDVSTNETSKRPKKTTPSKVRVLHLLKKHKESRKPSSWRQKEITITKEEATKQLTELMHLLDEVRADPEELRATFEELARTESDCSSAKRGGDLGFFTRKKMQPAFEDAAFALDIGEMSGVVDTNSGVHVILRLG
jgi:NIMA-interacting peptidyl-prolyl cis-trans isomerase 1